MTISKKNKIPITADDLSDDKMKFRVTCWIDGDILKELRRQAKLQGLKYQTLLNKNLRDQLFGDQSESLFAKLDRIEKALLNKKK